MSADFVIVKTKKKDQQGLIFAVCGRFLHENNCSLRYSKWYVMFIAYQKSVIHNNKT